MKCILLTSITLLASSSFATAIGQTHEAHTAGMIHGAPSVEALETSLPNEGGQSAFTAIAEIVKMLESDPTTDWSNVRIDALRHHLVDMDRLTLDADVETLVLNGTRIQFRISGRGRTLDAINRMVPAHASVVNDSTHWSIDVEHDIQGITLRIDPADAQGFIKLNALGFFGFMAIGAHHQAHHYQMALGQAH